MGYDRSVLIDQNKAMGHKTPFEQRVDAILANHSPSTTDRILVVGAGFGGMVEAWHDAGYANCWGVDSSPWIETNKATMTRNDVILVSEDIRNGGQFRLALRQNTGDDEYDWVITEDVVSCYADADLATMIPLVETLLFNGTPLTNIIHMTTYSRGPGTMDSALNAKTLQEWQTAYPSYSWMGMAGEVP